jgi:hypothetical protein
MMSFFEYIAQSQKITLPDTHTMLSMAGVSLDVPNEEETKRLLNRDKKRLPPPEKVSPRRSIAKSGRPSNPPPNTTDHEVHVPFAEGWTSGT